MNIMDEVIVNTDTVFDEEGVPVSIRKGAHARLLELNESWAQIIVWWDEEGEGKPEMLGVNPKYLEFFAHIQT
jgi:hypothetical protein